MGESPSSHHRDRLKAAKGQRRERNLDEYVGQTGREGPSSRKPCRRREKSQVSRPV